MRVDRVTIIQASLALFAAALIGKAAKVQLIDGDRWTADAARQQFASSSLPAPRGVITDATGRVLVESRELVLLNIDPSQVKDRKRLAKLLTSYGVPREIVKRASDPTRRGVELPKSFLPSDAATLSALGGVHSKPTMDRVLVASPSVRRLVGRTTPAGNPVDGIESSLDSLLRGERGTVTVLRDARGRRFESPTGSGTPSRAGDSVQLTINQALQDICERALADAVARLGAAGGDIVVMNPHNGEVLAMASQTSDARTTAATALTDPYEPGSTLKPFLAAKLIDLKRARVDDVVSTENGRWTINGRTIQDIHKAPALSLADVIRFSSNIGIVKFGQRLQPGEQFEMLRDLGFGTQTGVPYPVEASGVLRPVQRWGKQSQASLAMGYELSVTPLQLATAYAAIANGGELLQPSLVKEIRDSEGRVRYRHQRTVVRRVMSPETAHTVLGLLAGVVESGTAMEADLATYAVAGKSGTARRTEGGGGYQSGKYIASFVGLFPASSPQYVILVKLVDPAGIYYGGKTAAPVTRAVLLAAISARDAALDRGALARAVREPPHHDSAHANGGATRIVMAASPETLKAASIAPKPVEAEPEQHGAAPFIVKLPAPPTEPAPTVRMRSVPDVQGLTLRGAVRALHAAGFRVQLERGAALSTRPAAGELARTGTIVRLTQPQ